MHESNPEKNIAGFSETQIKEAEESFERLAQRLNELWDKEQELTESEKGEVELILNNAMVIQDVLEGKKPEEFS
jgi:hypothetical protein